jgi:methyl-accepting chemotaxis protein
MRAADAAKNTANLIEGTVKKVKDGTEIVTHTNEAFQEVAQSATKVGELVAEIAAASNEQAQGIGQVNTAVAEMDKVVQATAANAEESASASEELNAQAEQMKGNVGALVALVRGTGGNGQTAPKATPARVAGAIKKVLPITINKAKAKALSGSVRNKVKPEEVLPMHDSEFKDF